MGLLSSNTRLDKLEDLFLHELEDLYDAEKRLTKALPLMMEAAKNPKLKMGFEQHLRETEGQIARLERIFDMINRKPERETCDAMKGLIAEGNEAINARGNDDVRDAALIAAAQRVEHYEIAGYGTLRTFAKTLGMHEAATLLQQTLDEEEATDKKLTEIAVSIVNPRAEMA